jgi:DNA polymerase III epsilon subunit-like protein
VASLKAKLRSSVNKESVRVRQWLADNAGKVVYLDTETTGLANNDQIIELAIIDNLGATLFNQRFKPSVAIHPEAMAVHNITEADLAGCPRWPQYQEQISQILTGKVAVIFNQGFDIRMLQQTAAAFNCPVDWIAALPTQCAMMTAVRAYGATNRHGTISLANAAGEAGLSWHGQAHNALADCDMTRRLMMAIAKHCEPVLNDLEKAEKQRA